MPFFDPVGSTPAAATATIDPEQADTIEAVCDSTADPVAVPVPQADADAYRPATPILNWGGPRRSHHAPKMRLWMCITVICVALNVLCGVVPAYLSKTGKGVFLGVVIGVGGVLVACLMYLSTTRHLHELAALMDSINTPLDMDLVVEELQAGRFSRFEEPWKVQVCIIKMFCRLLKFHHGVNPVSGARIPVPVGVRAPNTFWNADFGSPSDDMHSAVSDDETTEFSVRDNVPSLMLSRRKSGLSNADPLLDNEQPWDVVLGPDTQEFNNRSLILTLLKQVKIGEDLSKIAFPVHVLEPRSLLEKLSDLFVFPEHFGAIAEEEDPVQRMIAVCRWLISGFCLRPKGARKPYNPILGETFECLFQQKTRQEIYYFAEQVSHHPPGAVLRAIHFDSGTELVGSYFPKSKLVTLNTGASIGQGVVRLSVPKQRDTYHFNWPNAYFSGILSAPIRIEIGGVVNITSEAAPHITAEIEFVTKGWFSGEYDTIRGGVFDRTNPKKPNKLFSFSGRWYAVTRFQPCTNGTPVGDSMALTDPTVHQPRRPWVPPTGYPRPSRVVWQKATVALRKGDAQAAHEAKQEIETQQRELRRAREARGVVYVPGYFRMCDESASASKAVWQYTGPPVYPSSIGGGSCLPHVTVVVRTSKDDSAKDFPTEQETTVE